MITDAAILIPLMLVLLLPALEWVHDKVYIYAYLVFVVGFLLLVAGLMND